MGVSMEDKTKGLGWLILLVAVFNCICAVIAFTSPEFAEPAFGGMVVFTGSAFFMVLAGLWEEASKEERAKKELARKRQENTLTKEEIAEIKRAVGGFSKHIAQFIGCVLIIVSLGSVIASFCGWFVSSFGMVAFILLLIFIFK